MLQLPAFAATPKEGAPVGEVVRLSGGPVTLQDAADAFLDQMISLAPPQARASEPADGFAWIVAVAFVRGCGPYSASSLTTAMSLNRQS